MLLIIPIRLNTHSFIGILNLNLKLVIMLEMQINVISSLKGYSSNWNRELFKVGEILKTQPPMNERRYEWRDNRR